ncbi:MAG: LysM peptidoglycan-binding domain-containing protein [Acidimicrobiia bacterium]
MRTKMSLTAVAGVAVLALSACGGSGDDTSDTSLNPLGSATVFRTILPTTTTLSVDASVDPNNPAAIPGEASYSIISGDFPIAVARKLGCESWDLIAAFNEIDPDPNEFPFPGTVLKIPPDCAGEPVVETTETTAATSTATTAAPTATTGADGSATYTVQAGDTVSGIASNFDVTPQALAAANGWSDGINHAIFPGDEIIIPGPSSG